MKRLVLCLSLFLLSYVNYVNAEVLDGVAAVVNDEIITKSDVMHQYWMIEQQLKEAGKPVPKQTKLEGQVLQHMIDVELQIQEAKAFGINASDEEVASAIKKIALENKIAESELMQHVKQQGYSYDQYRKNIKEQMTLSKVQQHLVGSKVHVRPDMLEREYRHALNKNSNRNEFYIKNILIPLSDIPTSKEYARVKRKADQIYRSLKKGQSFDSLAVSESSDFSALEGGDLGWRSTSAMPAVFVKPVLKLKVGGVSSPIETSNGFHIVKLVDMRSAIKKHLIDTTHVRHILLRTPESTSINAVKKRIEHLRGELVSGKDFAKLAHDFSDDMGSAKIGGDIGWVKPGDLVPEFEHAVGQLPLNEISQPVKTVFGWHIIQVLGRKKKDDSLERYKNKIAQQLYQREYESRIKDWLQSLRSKSYITVKSA